MPASPHPFLIFDLGMNHGEDTAFYLAKGFSVVGVEASPLLARSLGEDFAFDIQARHLTLLHCGVWHAPGALTFYVNEDNDHWSSFDAHYGTRQGSRFHTVEVPCTTLAALFAQHGVPHYLKVDVEGADRHVLAALRGMPVLPNYVSVEEYGVQAVEDLAAAGYTRFQALPQANKSWAVPPRPAREGRFVERRFGGADSGLFGLELPQDGWMGHAEFSRHFTQQILPGDAAWRKDGDDWFDIHATR